MILTRCQRIFSTTFNPDRIRTGNKILRQRLKGHVLAEYYPRKLVTIADVAKAYKKHGMETYDEDELERLEDLERRKARGKGAPKKKRTAPERAQKKKKR